MIQENVWAYSMNKQVQISWWLEYEFFGRDEGVPVRGGRQKRSVCRCLGQEKYNKDAWYFGSGSTGTDMHWYLVVLARDEPVV